MTGMGTLEDYHLDNNPKAVLRRVGRKLELLLMDRGVPAERPIPDLPIERPNFALLFGPSSNAAASLTSAMKSKLGGKTSAQPPEPIHPTSPSERGADVQVTDKMTMTWVSAFRRGVHR